MSDLSWKWDYYGATAPEQAPMTGIDALLHLSDEPVRRCAGLYGYTRGWEIRREGSVIARVLEAHGKPDHIQASGGTTPLVVQAVRRHLPGAGVARADVCYDFGGGPLGFAAARQRVFDMNLGKVTLRDVIEHGISGTARTLYLGKRGSSEMFGRVYQSGLIHAEQDPDTNRLEYECRPGKSDRKAHLGTLEPAEVPGWSRWSRNTTAELVGHVAPAAPPRCARVSDRDAAWNALAAQYGRRLWELAEFHGGDVESAFLDLLNRCGPREDNWTSVGTWGGENA